MLALLAAQIGRNNHAEQALRLRRLNRLDRETCFAVNCVCALERYGSSSLNARVEIARHLAQTSRSDSVCEAGAAIPCPLPIDSFRLIQERSFLALSKQRGATAQSKN